MPIYRVFGPAQAVQQLANDIEIKESYPAFTIVSAPDDVIATVRKRYPVESMETGSSLGTTANDVGDTLRGTLDGTESRVVHFDAPVQPEWQRLLQELGVTVLRSLGPSALIVSVGSDEVLGRIKTLPHVVQVDPYAPTLRISPQFLTGLGGDVGEDGLAAAKRSVAMGGGNTPAGRSGSLPGILVADFFTPQDRDRAANQLAQQNIRIAHRVEPNRLILDLTSATEPLQALQTIAEQPGLRVLEEQAIRTSFNNAAG